ncbi:MULTISPECIES: DUF502 domain-containing protein [Limnobacter]|uniref:DUF502 domain-containing protein n=1 Tax=Limnobacter litoralis TaxID=481366 RepID=A0ABQ5YM30_9BURK|nr:MULTISPECIES: DUF502 domain-containing protein [Limnobacter]GLR25643.1 hypothetical protein GCM10007875_07310 [Limnobacter litoralis]
MKKYLLAGLLVWIPLVITVWVLSSIVSTMDQSLLLLPDSWHTERIFGVHIPGVGALLTLAILLLTGVLAANIVGERFFHYSNQVLSKIPFFNSIYSSVKQVSDTLLSSSGQAFRQAVLVRYPHAESWSIGFITGDLPIQMEGQVEGPAVSVFVPTAPNPTAGFVLLVPEKDLRPSGLTVDEALKYIVSMGVVAPHSETHSNPNLQEKA